MSKKWFRLRDSYGLSIDPGQDDALILAVAVCTDLMAHGGKEENEAKTTSGLVILNRLPVLVSSMKTIKD